MPQLDLFTFFPQLFWGFLFFFLQFFVVSYYFLPLLASSLKFKQKYLAFLFEKETFFSSQANHLNPIISKNLLLSFIKEIDDNFCKIFITTTNLDKTSKKILLTKFFFDANHQIIKTSYLSSVLSRFSIYSFKLLP